MVNARPARPRPIPDDDSRPFWEGCRAGKLLLQQCPECEAVRYPPRPMCPRCSAIGASWIEASGRGSIYSWVIPHHAVHPSLVDEVPYNVVMVDLEEGPRMVSNLIDTAPEQIEVDLPVEVVFETVDDELTVPKFRRRDDA
jgi:uncharacterized OB-fold protein